MEDVPRTPTRGWLVSHVIARQSAFHDISHKLLSFRGLPEATNRIITVTRGASAWQWTRTHTEPTHWHSEAGPIQKYFYLKRGTVRYTQKICAVISQRWARKKAPRSQEKPGLLPGIHQEEQLDRWTQEGPGTRRAENKAETQREGDWTQVELIRPGQVGGLGHEGRKWRNQKGDMGGKWIFQPKLEIIITRN